MTKSLGQNLYEAKEKHHKKKSLFYSIVPWKMLNEAEQMVWKKHAKSFSGKNDLAFYNMGINYHTGKFVIKKRPPPRYLNKPTTENNATRAFDNQSLLSLLDVADTVVGFTGP